MRSSIITSFSALAAMIWSASATEDPCAQMCSYVEGCANSKYDSYCKSWQSPSVCFGLVKKTDGSICFEPGDVDCVGEPIACGDEPTMAPGSSTAESTTEMPGSTTVTAGSSTVESTTEMPGSTTVTAGSSTAESTTEMPGSTTVTAGRSTVESTTEMPGSTTVTAGSSTVESTTDMPGSTTVTAGSSTAESTTGMSSSTTVISSTPSDSSTASSATSLTTSDSSSPTSPTHGKAVEHPMKTFLEAYVSQASLATSTNHICALGMSSEIADTIDSLLTRLDNSICHIVDIEKWDVEIVESLKGSSYGDRVLIGADYEYVPKDWAVPKCSLVLIGPSLRVTPLRIRQLAGDQNVFSAAIFLDEHVCAPNPPDRAEFSSPSVPCQRLLQTWRYVSNAAMYLTANTTYQLASGVRKALVHDPVVPASVMSDGNCERFRKGHNYISPAECHLDHYILNIVSNEVEKDKVHFFVDVSLGNSPFHGSASFMLEKCQGWAGLCVLSGQNPELENRWHSFRAYRSCRILDHSVEHVSQAVSEDRLISRQGSDSRGNYRLDDLLKQADMSAPKTIDVLLVDVATSQNEVAVMAGINLADFDIKTIIVKVNTEAPIRLTELDYILTSQGFVKTSLLCDAHAVYKRLPETFLSVPTWKIAALPPIHSTITERVIDQETSRWFGVAFVD